MLAECQEDFVKSPKELIQPQLPEYSDFKNPFLINSVSSKEAGRAVLSQIVGGQKLPIAYALKMSTK